MKSRKKLLADKSRASFQLGGDIKVEDGEGRSSRGNGSGLDPETPKRVHRKLTHKTKPQQSDVHYRTSSPVPASNARELPESSEHTCAQIEESSSFKKTPKSLSRCKPWSPALNSPYNDVEQHHDVFWDPYSPTAYKLENGKKKQTSSKCKVDISDIVNRIDPKRDKPEDGTFIKMWIEDDSIPPTPAVTRTTRTKVNLRTRSLHTEQELMKLAKQFDRNLIESLQPQDQDKAVPLNTFQSHEMETFLEDIPEDDVELALKSVSQISGVSASSYCLKSVDQDAEAALNAIFDCSTQKVSGRLSQTLSDISIDNVLELPTDVKQDKLLDKGGSKMSETSTNPKHVTSHDNVSLHKFQASKSLPKDLSRQNGPFGLSEAKPRTSKIQDDFEDDWGTDFLEDDSFVMEITQNPTLIAAPGPFQTNSNSLHCSVDTVVGKTVEKDKDNVKSVASNFVSNKLNHFKFKSRTSNAPIHSKPNDPEEKNIFPIGNDLIVNKTENRISNLSTCTVSQLPLPPQKNTEGCNRTLKNSTLFSPKNALMCSNAPKNNITNTNLSGQKLCSQQRNNVSVKTFTQHLPQKQNRGNGVNKPNVQLDEWNDPKFSDDVLDMFCESDCLWEANEEDDDLLYQVCDDVERLTQAEIPKEDINNKSTEKTSLFCVKKGAKTANQGQPSQHFGKSKIRSSFTFPSSTNVPNKFSGNATLYNSSSNSSLLKTSAPNITTESSIHGNCFTSTQKDTLDRTNQVSAKFNQSQTATMSSSSSAPSKFTFTRIKSSQAVNVQTDSTHTEGMCVTFKNTDLQGENTNRKNTSKQPSQHFNLKRQLSDSFSQSAKVFVAEERNKKCSIEEIERKKQEALARRQMRTRALSNDISHAQ